MPVRQILAATLAGAALAAAAPMASLPVQDALAAPAPRAASLAEARYAPTYLAIVKPGRTVAPARALRSRTGEPCRGGGYYSDVAAYRWNGSALGAQHYHGDHYAWHAKPGRVTYDGIGWTNETRSAVIVAGWCE